VSPTKQARGDSGKNPNSISDKTKKEKTGSVGGQFSSGQTTNMCVLGFQVASQVRLWIDIIQSILFSSFCLKIGKGYTKVKE